MLTTKVLSLFLLVPNNLQSFLSGDSDSIYIKFKNAAHGTDQRYDINNNTNISMLYMLDKIRKHIINKNIIEELENNNTNIHNKLDIIERYTDIYKDQNRIAEFNLFGGKLLDNFYDL
jgi:hypothetical protein